MLGLIWSFFTVSEIHLEVKERVHFKEEERSFWNSDAENPDRWAEEKPAEGRREVCRRPGWIKNRN